VTSRREDLAAVALESQQAAVRFPLKALLADKSHSKATRWAWKRAHTRRSLLQRGRGCVSRLPIIAKVRAVMCEACRATAEKTIRQLLKLSRSQS
jgi:hypothetical protein